jgi:(p)ppGpp synthase/HD superfamily hydrolase
MTDADLIDLALAFCVKAHAGQRDKNGAAYALHPIRVALAVEGAEARAAALLHDVVEDTGRTPDDLRAEGVPETVLAAVDALTKRPGEDYPAFVARAAAHPVARRVKRADIDDNLDVTRLASVAERDRERLNRYLAARRLLDET